MKKLMKNVAPALSEQLSPHTDSSVIHWHNPDGTPTTHQSHISDGKLYISEYLRERTKLTQCKPLYIINDDDIALVITHNTCGYGDCEMDDCLLDDFGYVEIPAKYRALLPDNEVTISLPYEHDEIVIETATAKGFFINPKAGYTNP